MSRFPRRRTDGIIERSLDGETVVYDERTDRVTHLDAATAVVWHACDGDTAIPELASANRQPEDEVLAVIARLDEAQLLTSSGISRRQLLARTGAIAWTAPLVSIAAPVAAAAASPAAPVVSGFAHCCNGAHTERFDITVTGLPAGQYSLTCLFSPGGSLTATASSTTGSAVFSFPFPSTGNPVKSRTLTVVSITLPDGSIQNLSGSYSGTCPGRQC